MNKRLLLSIAAALACILTLALNFTGPEKTLAQGTTRDDIKKSMEETLRQKEQLHEFFMTVDQQLMKNGYRDVHTSFRIDEPFSSEPPSITIRVKNKEYKNAHGDAIKTIIQQLVSSYDLGNVAIKVKIQDGEFNRKSKKERKKLLVLSEITDIAHEALKKKGYNKITTISIDLRSSKRIIEIKIEGSKQHYHNVKHDIQKTVHDAIYAKKHLHYKVKVIRRTEKEIRDMNWQPIFHSIIEETDKHFDEVTGFAYSYHPKPLHLIIKTSLSKDESGSKDRAEEIENYVRQVIEIKGEELSVEKIPYQIVIRGKDHKKLN